MQRDACAVGAEGNFAGVNERERETDCYAAVTVAHVPLFAPDVHCFRRMHRKMSL